MLNDVAYPLWATRWQHISQRRMKKNISFEEEENQTKKTVQKKNTRVFRRIRCI